MSRCMSSRSVTDWMTSPFVVGIGCGLLADDRRLAVGNEDGQRDHRDDVDEHAQRERDQHELDRFARAGTGPRRRCRRRRPASGGGTRSRSSALSAWMSETRARMTLPRKPSPPMIETPSRRPGGPDHGGGGQVFIQVDALTGLQVEAAGVAERHPGRDHPAASRAASGSRPRLGGTLAPRRAGFFLEQRLRVPDLSRPMGRGLVIDQQRQVERVAQISRGRGHVGLAMPALAGLARGHRQVGTAPERRDVAPRVEGGIRDAGPHRRGGGVGIWRVREELRPALGALQAPARRLLGHVQPDATLRALGGVRHSLNAQRVPRWRNRRRPSLRWEPARRSGKYSRLCYSFEYERVAKKFEEMQNSPKCPRIALPIVPRSRRDRTSPGLGRSMPHGVASGRSDGRPVGGDVSLLDDPADGLVAIVEQVA